MTRSANKENKSLLTGLKVLLVTNNDWGFYNFRMPLARVLREAGATVVLVCPEGEYAPNLRAAGFRVVPWKLRRSSLGPLTEARALLSLTRIYRAEAPDIVQHFTVKPNLYGPVAAAISRTPYVINTWTGTGFLFSDSRTARALRPFATFPLRLMARSKRLWSIFQTDDDRDACLRLKVATPDRSLVIPGSGVNIEQFHPALTTASGPPIALMSARLLREKGVGEFVRAAQLLRDREIDVSFQLAGAPDGENRAGITKQELDAWRSAGVVEFLGHREDMPELLRKAHIAVLPTFYNEGVPKSLLEAAASGLPIVATDIAACRAVVRNGRNGLIIPPRDHVALADAIERLVKNPELRHTMGAASRAIAVENFEEQVTVRRYLDLYRQIGLRNTTAETVGAPTD